MDRFATVNDEDVAELLVGLDQIPEEAEEPEEPQDWVPQPWVPTPLVEFLRSICRREWVAREVFERADERVRRRLRGGAAAVEARWAKRWSPPNVEGTKRMLRHLRNRVLRVHHEGQLAFHRTFGSLPDALRPWRPNRDGELLVSDLQIITPSVGSPSFFEQSHPKILRWVYETFRERQRERALRVGTRFRPPRVWDLTAGSGTSIDLLGSIHGCEVIASDLTVVAGTGIGRGDCRDVGHLPAHHGLLGLSTPPFARRRPDIILFDPPSRGRPTHAELYESARPSKSDLGLLDMEGYVGAVASTIVDAAKCLAPGGMISVVLRGGHRRGSDVFPDPEVVLGLTDALREFVLIGHEMPIVYRGRRAQTSLGTARIPTVHLLVERRA